MNRRTRITRHQAEQLLDAPTGADELSALLRDVAATPSSGEVPGEIEALAAFRASAPAPATGSDSLMSKFVRRAVTAPVATAGALGAIGATGR